MYSHTWVSPVHKVGLRAKQQGGQEDRLAYHMTCSNIACTTSLSYSLEGFTTGTHLWTPP